MAETQSRLNDAAGALRTAPADVPERIVALLDDRRRLDGRPDLRRQLATGGGPRPLWTGG